MKMRELVDRPTLASLILLGFAKLLQLAERLGLRSRKDGWRKCTEVFHRREEAKHIVGIFGLQRPTGDTWQENLVDRLHAVFAELPQAGWALERGIGSTRRLEHGFVDFVLAEFDGEGRLVGQRFIPDRRGPEHARESLRRRARAVFLWFDSVPADDGQRFVPPDFVTRQRPGAGVFNICCRPGRGFIDLWFQTSHIAVDGGPASELFQAVAGAFGVVESARSFPGKIPEYHMVFPPGERGREACLRSAVADFSRLAEERRRLAAEEGLVSLVALFVWRLALQPHFKGRKFNVPVSIPATGDLEQTLGFVFTRPAAWHDESRADKGFAAYNSDFNRQIELVQERSSPGYRFMELTAVVPAPLYRLVLKLFPGGLKEMTGQVCVSLVRGVEYGLPSLSDNVDEVIAVGDIDLPGPGGRPVGVVGMAAPADRMDGVRRAVLEAF